MSKGYALDEDMQKYFIVSRPTKLSDLQLDNIDDAETMRAVKRGRKLRARREAQLEDQIM
jgi:hypothetical protein